MLGLDVYAEKCWACKPHLFTAPGYKKDLIHWKAKGWSQLFYNLFIFFTKSYVCRQQTTIQWRKGPELFSRHLWSIVLIDTLCIWLKHANHPESWNPSLLIKTFLLMLSELSLIEPALLVFVMGPRLINNGCAVMRNLGKPLEASERYPHLWQQAVSWQTERGWKPGRPRVWQ